MQNDKLKIKILIPKSDPELNSGLNKSQFSKFQTVITPIWSIGILNLIFV